MKCTSVAVLRMRW